MKQPVSEISWKVGGQQGEGIESCGEILASALNTLGYYLYGYRHFSSRIKGGHTSYTIRIGCKPLGTVQNSTDILVALDQETLMLYGCELAEGGIVLADEKLDVHVPLAEKVQVIPVPFASLAAESGSMLRKNTVALGVTAALLGLEADFLTEMITGRFNKKKAAEAAGNLTAVRSGHAYMTALDGGCPQQWRIAPVAAQRRLFLMGNEALALGAVTAGAKFMAAYPITPASEIMEYMIKALPGLGGAVIQTEDEIAACMMAIGANYTGARAFTATSGPGLSLMAEAIGLAGMTETPLVVVDTQRGGPSTGLPTKNEQSDVMAAIYNTHGEIPKIVLAPSTVEEAFYDGAEAFNLAEEYQCPVILLTDLQLSLGKQTVEPLQYDRVSVRRGKICSAQELLPLKAGEYFRRFEVTPDGVSPRTLPGTSNGVHLITGLEHDETGKPAEGTHNRCRQLEKRQRKLTAFLEKYKQALYVNAPHACPELVLVGMGSSRGALAEAAEALNGEGRRVNHVQVRLLHPFPYEELRSWLPAGVKTVIAEQNFTGQLVRLMTVEFGRSADFISLKKYDGSIFTAADILSKCREVL